MFAKKSFPQPFFYLLGVFLLLLLIGLTGIFRPIRSLVEKMLVVPLTEQVFVWKRVFKKDLGGTALGNERQTAELKATISSLTQENRELRRLLSSPLPKDWQFLPIKVIGIEGEELVLNLGSRDGVILGMAGVFGNNYLGKIVTVSEKLSKLRLPSYWEERIAAEIIKSDISTEIKGKGLSIGRGSGKIRVEQILSSENVEKGDLVVTNIEGGSLLLGEVEEVIFNKGDAFKTVSVKRLFNPEELTTIFLIRGKI